MSEPAFDPLAVAVRAYAVPLDPALEAGGPKRKPRPSKHRQPQRTLVFDTETTIDPSQRLNFGVWRYHIDRPDSLPGSFCSEEGIFHADDLPDCEPEGFAVLEEYVGQESADVRPGRPQALRLLSRSAFVEEMIYRRAFRHAATVVGFNLPFDLSRLAVDAAPARGRFLGGNSLRLFENERYRPRIAYQAIDSKRTLMGFTMPHGASGRRGSDFRGYFLDLRTLTFALTDRSFTLEGACRAFGIDYTKREVAHGTITTDYVTYCREDVAATARLLRAAAEEYRRHPIDLQITKAYSPASIGKAYLAAMGVRPRG